MISKWITGTHLGILDGIIKEQGWTPIPLNSMALVKIDERGIAAFHILQMKAHPEPLYVREDMRGTGLAADVAQEMANFLEATGTNSFICIADKPEVAKLCESLGMRRIDSPVYVK